MTPAPARSIVFQEMEAAMRSKDPRATVSPQLSNLHIYDKWRVQDVTTLTNDERAEYEADVAESNRRYDKAYGNVLSHTSKEEQRAFWAPFSGNNEELYDSLETSKMVGGTRLRRGAGGDSNGPKLPRQTMENPMFEAVQAGTDQLYSSMGKKASFIKQKLARVSGGAKPDDDDWHRAPANHGNRDGDGDGEEDVGLDPLRSSEWRISTGEV